VNSRPDDWLGGAIISSHPYLVDECASVGAETIGGIQAFLAGLPPAPLMTLTPGLQPNAIHRPEMIQGSEQQ
jgi:hypothetical protein